jgi:hypothetical protein
LLTPENRLKFPGENIYASPRNKFSTRQFRKARYLAYALNYNFKRGRRDFWNQLSKNLVAFPNENVIFRPYTESLNSWVTLSLVESWFFPKATISQEQRKEMIAIANSYVDFTTSYAKKEFGLEFHSNVIDALLDYARKHMIYVAELYTSAIAMAKKSRIKHLLTPTAGSTTTRAIALAAKNTGAKVTGFPHGYFICHHRGSRKALHEFATVDEFVAYTPGSVELFERNIKLNPPPRNNPTTFPYEENTELLTQWEHFSSHPIPDKIKTVMVLELSLIPEWAGYYAAEAMVNYHFYYQICSTLGKAGYKVLFKRRPKDISWEKINIFENLPNVEIVYGSFGNHAVLDSADAFIIQYGMSSTLFQAMCTNKTVIYADAGWEDWFPDVYELMAKRCDILHCHYDERNRACFDENELLGILGKKPDTPNTEFMEKYLFP